MDYQALHATLEPVAELTDVLEQQHLHNLCPAGTLPENFDLLSWNCTSDKKSFIAYPQAGVTAAITLGMLRGMRFVFHQLDEHGEMMDAYIRYKLRPCVAFVDALEKREDQFGNYWQNAPDSTTHWFVTMQSVLPRRERIELRLGDFRDIRWILT